MVAHRERMAPVFDEYFASRAKETLINAEDFAVIGAYKGKVTRGDPAVEFVIDNYDAFAAVAPENAVAAFVLESNYYTVQRLANAGDEAYLEQLDMLDGPLRRAAEFQRDLEPDSALLREFQEESFRNGYLAQTGRWAELKQAVEARLAKPGANRARGDDKQPDTETSRGPRRRTLSLPSWLDGRTIAILTGMVSIAAMVQTSHSGLSDDIHRLRDEMYAMANRVAAGVSRGNRWLAARTHHEDREARRTTSQGGDRSRCHPHPPHRL